MSTDTEREAFEAWLQQGMDYAYTEATDPTARDDWTTEDIAKAFSAGAALAQRGSARAAAAPAQPVEMSPDFTDTARAALLWVLWHHQGGSSPVGQPLRFALGMGAHDRLSEHQITEAKRWAYLTKSATADFHAARVTGEMVARLEASAESLKPAQPLTQRVAELEEALVRLWPLLDKAAKGYVFTAARAGEVAADMETLRRAVLAAAQEQQK